jgi:methyl-accepting chemotaxis protein
MSDSISNIPGKVKLENVVVELNMIKAIIDSLFQEVSKSSSSVSTVKDSVNEIHNMLEEIVNVSNNISEDSQKRNEDAINKLNEAVEFLKTNKEQITEELTKKLGLDEKLEVLDNKITQITSMFKEIHNTVEEMNKSVDNLSLATNQLSSSVLILNNNLKNLGLPKNYTEEASEVIDYLISRRTGPPVTFGELALKFNINVVREVLMTAHKLGYIEWR